MTRYEFFLVHCLDKVLPDSKPETFANPRLMGFCGETLSIQLAYFAENDDYGDSSTLFGLEVKTDRTAAVTLRRVELVPCRYPCHGTYDEDYLITKPGLYPDLLLPLEAGTPIKAIPAQWRSLWIDVDAEPGEHEVILSVTDMEHRLLAELSFSVRVLEDRLPEAELYHTEWFHTDCLANYYHVPVFSEDYWRIVDNFMQSAVRHGINMILTPIFTPPLDTARGGERTTVQLLTIAREEGTYRFDFSRLDRWLALCEKNGIRYLEMAHFFTQWGAAYAPKIMVRIETGEEVRLFGWHTGATDQAYTEFLHALIPALKAHLSEKGWLDRTFFHISDEPHEEEVATYSAARRSIDALLADCKVMDALSSFSLYRDGVVDRPIVGVDHIQPFIDEKVPHLWAYYCTVQAVRVPNRFIAMPSTRNRILGTLLYKEQIEGFLHWGFNFYNSQRSIESIDPYCVTDAGEAFPSGDPFLVYPAPDGTAYESIRGMVLRQALYDLRALRYAECRRGREATVKLLEDLFGGPMSFENYPHDKRFFEELRQAIAEERNE